MPTSKLEDIRTAQARAAVRESLVELWAQIFESELRADLAAEADASGERERLLRIEAAPLRGDCADDGLVAGELQPRRQP